MPPHVKSRFPFLDLLKAFDKLHILSLYRLKLLVKARARPNLGNMHYYGKNGTWLRKERWDICAGTLAICTALKNKSSWGWRKTLFELCLYGIANIATVRVPVTVKNVPLWCWLCVRNDHICAYMVMTMFPQRSQLYLYGVNHVPAMIATLPVWCWLCSQVGCTGGNPLPAQGTLSTIPSLINTYRLFIKYCVFSGFLKIFRTLAFLCFPLV